MDRKKVLISVLSGAMAVVLLAVLLLHDRETPPAGTAGPRPGVQSQTHQTQPGLDGGREDAETGPSEAPAAEQTEPDRDDPEQTRPDRDDPEQLWPDETEPDETEPTETAPDRNEHPVQAGTSFPAVLEDGRLIVQSLFQFTGMNPDAGNEFGEDIAGVEILNNSGSHMTFAEVTVEMADGSTMTFRAEDIPVGWTAMAFSLEHMTVPDVRDCVEVRGYAEFESGDPLQSDLVQCTVDGIGITVRNVSGRDLTDLELTCHGLLDSSFFGGATYQYHIPALPAGASTVVYAEDCYLGMTSVVRVEIGS